MNTTTYESPGSLHLDIAIPAGSVSVSAEDTTTVTLDISGEQNPDEISVSFEPDGGGHRLVVEQRKRGLFLALKTRDLRVRVTVPNGTHVDVKGGSTDLKARGRLGSLAFHTGSGDATVEEVEGDAVAKVASGDLSVKHVTGRLSFHSASGDLDAGLVEGGATARTASGDVKIGTAGREVKATTVSGDIEIEQLLPGAMTSLQAVSGDIEVGIAAGTRVYLDLSAVSGSTTSDLTDSDAPTEASTTEQAEVKASTVSGDVKVRHSRV